MQFFLDERISAQHQHESNNAVHKSESRGNGIITRALHRLVVHQSIDDVLGISRRRFIHRHKLFQSGGKQISQAVDEHKRDRGQNRRNRDKTNLLELVCPFERRSLEKALIDGDDPPQKR